MENFTKKKKFNIEEFIDSTAHEPIKTSIFKLFDKLERYPIDLKELCYQYAGNDISKWWNFMELADKVKRAYDDYICDYDKSMVLNQEVSFPVVSSYRETNQSQRIRSWVWCRKDGSGSNFTFDSEAERQWAQLLKECEEDMQFVDGEEGKRCLWGKNFPASSEIKYEYYSNGVHVSYPDFVMKDKKNRIHIFEVKSVNISNEQKINSEEYKAKINSLKECYKACSKILNNHIFYLPTLKEDDWSIIKYENGKENIISEAVFCKSLE